MKKFGLTMPEYLKELEKTTVDSDWIDKCYEILLFPFLLIWT